MNVDGEIILWNILSREEEKIGSKSRRREIYPRPVSRSILTTICLKWPNGNRDSQGRLSPCFPLSFIFEIINYNLQLFFFLILVHIDRSDSSIVGSFERRKGGDYWSLVILTKLICQFQRFSEEIWSTRQINVLLNILVRCLSQHMDKYQVSRTTLPLV